jgi:hypothetical protein
VDLRIDRKGDTWQQFDPIIMIVVHVFPNRVFDGSVGSFHDALALMVIWNRKGQDYVPLFAILFELFARKVRAIIAIDFPWESVYKEYVFFQNTNGFGSGACLCRFTY